MKRRRAEESADGLALMTSSVTSSYSADGLREQSQDSVGSLYNQTQERSDVVKEEIQSQATVHQQIIQQMLFALRSSSRKIPAGSICLIPAGQPDASNSSIQSRKKRRSSEAWQTDTVSSRSDKSAAKQLTIYESLMSTAELNSNGENDKKPAKEKDAISHTVAAVVHLWSLGVLTAAGCGIGSVHEVVRSNLLVEFSEVEEGEM
ncbi:hypothetical protein F511_27927 [Dorcoceras hygrometricum]|uniref:Uncharacterized protein n=1 Tax=Dorcoceras hygrometricum TaxID=472368 RepID=A0A2Z7A768_9LAMI|nr:hypothetical protein F511_27927 [Dorcoceras hygrometricum]